MYVGGGQKYGPFLGPYYNTAPRVPQKGILTLPPMSGLYKAIFLHEGVLGSLETPKEHNSPSNGIDLRPYMWTLT